MGGGKAPDAGPGETALADIATQLFAETSPLRNDLISQFSELLNTGGVGAQVPIISQALESVKRASATNLEDLDEELARTGLAGTPFGAGIRSEAQTSASIKASQIPTDFARQFLQLIPSFVLGQGQQVVSGLSGVASAEVGREGVGAQRESTFADVFKTLVG